MRLLVVYGLKTGDYDWLAGFYPARRIAEACENRGIPLRFLFPGDVQAFLADSREFDPERTTVLIRGAVDALTYTTLEAAGYRCVNDARAVALARDKLETSRFLSSRRWPTPETHSLADAARRTPAFPLVVKPRFGSRGEGVALAHDARELSAFADGQTGGVEYVAQEFIESSWGRDVRVLFAGGDVIAVASRANGAGDLRSNACAGGATRLITDGSFARWEAMTLDIARDAGLWYGTVDWLYLEDGSMTVCEINSSPGFEALETAGLETFGLKASRGIDVAGAIVERLTRLAR